MLLIQKPELYAYDGRYDIEYTVTKWEKNNVDGGGCTEEYGIRCCLYDMGRQIDSKEVNGITTKREILDKFLEIIIRNRVFPTHLRDVLEDLLIMEYE